MLACMNSSRRTGPHTKPRPKSAGQSDAAESAGAHALAIDLTRFETNVVHSPHSSFSIGCLSTPSHPQPGDEHLKLSAGLCKKPAFSE
eukprot:6182431-Pleurochrysis_carterae.AAC.2